MIEQLGRTIRGASVDQQGMKNQATKRRANEPVGALASIARSGRICAFRRPDAVELCWTRSEKRRLIEAPGPTDFGFGAGGLWVLGGGYVHWMTEEGETKLACCVGTEVKTLAPSRSALPSCVLDGRGTDLCELYDGQLFSFPLVLGTRRGESVFPVGPRLLCVANEDAFRIVHLERGNIFSYAAPPGSVVKAVSPVFGGTGVAVVIGGDEPQVWLLRPTGERIYQTAIDRPDMVAFAEDRGLVLVATGDVLTAVDIRLGGEPEFAQTPFSIDDVDICARGRDLVLAQRNGERPRTWHVRFSDIFSS